jgi:mevalonate pyrophosphate decarboxylase
MSLLFSVKSLSIHRAGIRILDGINWIVNVGEHWVILGAKNKECNGASYSSSCSSLVLESPCNSDDERDGDDEFSSQRARLCAGSCAISDTTGFRLRTEAPSTAPLLSCLPLSNPSGIAFAGG